MRIHVPCSRHSRRIASQLPFRQQLRCFSHDKIPGRLQLPPLSEQDNILLDRGIHGFYTPLAFRHAYPDFQAWCLRELNQRIEQENFGDTSDDAIIRQLIHKWPNYGANGPSIFNFASMAYNNHFYMKNIQNIPIPMPSKLQKALEDSFGSVDNFRAEFIANAKAMFGPGFVWLVRAADSKAQKKHFYILRTYGSGSPRDAATLRHQTKMNVIRLADEDNIKADKIFAPGKPGDSGVLDTEPVLCVSTWQHSYLVDYGMAGKEVFLNKWWDRVDWEQVSDMLPEVSPSPAIRDPYSSRYNL